MCTKRERCGGMRNLPDRGGASRVRVSDDRSRDQRSHGDAHYAGHLGGGAAESLVVALTPTTAFGELAGA